MNAKISFNRIYVIESLFDEDTKTGQIICEDILKYRALKYSFFSFELFIPDTKEQLLNNLNEIKDSVKNHNWLPYIHFEVHGSKDGIILNSNTQVEWDELFDALQDINIACNNNLFISLATCFGAHMIRIYDRFNEPCPFYGYIGPYDRIGDRDLLYGYSEYFANLLDNREFESAIKALEKTNPLNKGKFSFLNCNVYFDLIIEKVRKDYTDPKMRTLRAKNLVRRYKIKFPGNKISNSKLIKNFERKIITDIDFYIADWRDIFCMNKLTQ